MTKAEFEGASDRVFIAHRGYLMGDYADSCIIGVGKTMDVVLSIIDMTLEQFDLNEYTEEEFGWYGRTWKERNIHQYAGFQPVFIEERVIQKDGGSLTSPETERRSSNE